MARKGILISYSHKDKRWLDELRDSLAPLVRKRGLSLWDDTNIVVGKKWRAEIRDALDHSQIAILLVSRHYLASDFIAKNELPPLLEAAEKNGLTIVWIAVGHSLYEETEITEYQAANDPTRPLNSLSEPDLDLQLVTISKLIDSISPNASGEAIEGPSSSPDSDVSHETNSLIRMRKALAEGKWAWRSVDRLAVKGGLANENEALKLLAEDPDIVLGRGRSGRRIARLQSRLT